METDLSEGVAAAEHNDPLTGTISYELRKASVAVMAALTGAFRQWDLRPSEANLLLFVGANPGCTQSDIARAHRSNPANLVPLIARLERDGLIERAPGEGRAIALSVSPHGAAVLDGVNGALAALEARLAARLDPQQRDVLVSALREVCFAACCPR